MANKKRFFGSHFQFSRWMGLGEIRHNAKSIKSLFNRLGNFEANGEPETFESAVERLKMSEEDINNRTMHFLRVALVYVFCAICMTIYGIYLYINSDFISAFMCLPIITVILSFAFKEHFWYTQMKNRRLGMSGKDWFEILIKGGPK